MSVSRLRMLLTGMREYVYAERDLKPSELALLRAHILGVMAEIDALVNGSDTKHSQFKPKVELADLDMNAIRPTGRRYDIMDRKVRCLGIRVSARGARTFMLKMRFPGSNNPTRRALGEYPEMTLEEARTKALEWRALVGRGIDPAAQAA